MEYNKLLRIRAHIWFVASLLSMQFVWAVLIYFYTIIMTNNGLLNASPCHVETALDTEWRPIVLLQASLNWTASGPTTTKVATSLLSMQCVGAMVICLYTITTKCNGPLNTFYCRSHNVRHELVFWRAIAGKPKFDGLFFLLWDWRLFTPVEYADLLSIWSDYSISILCAVCDVSRGQWDDDHGIYVALWII